jgi:chemotaxis protein MotB
MARKRQEHAHHGGAWKVAYADFVTAMMALFIVLWILSSSQETKAAVASYFRHPSVFKSGGTGFLTKEGMVEYREAVERIQAAAEGAENAEGAEGSGVAGETGVEAESETGGGARGDTSEALAAAQEDSRSRGTSPGGGAGGAGDEELSASARQLEAALRSTEALRAMAGQVSIGFVAEGLRIQVADVENVPLFELGSSVPTGNAREILEAIARVLAPLPNPILVEGHTDARPFAGEGNYTNWELSGERANAARRVLEATGVKPTRIASVVGYADRHLLFPDDPTSPRNRRISIIVCEGPASR